MEVCCDNLKWLAVRRPVWWRRFPSSLDHDDSSIGTPNIASLALDSTRKFFPRPQPLDTCVAPAANRVDATALTQAHSSQLNKSVRSSRNRSTRLDGSPRLSSGKSTISHARLLLGGNQNVLHAQSLGTLVATSWGGFARVPPEIILRWFTGPASGVGGPLSSLFESLLVWLFLRRSDLAVSQRWYWREQVSQARDGTPSGWNLASWSSGIMRVTCVEQKMCPQCLQWCLRTNKLKLDRH
jgi:hypothetical protein